MPALPPAGRPRTPLLLTLIATSVALFGCAEVGPTQDRAHLRVGSDLEAGSEGDWRTVDEGSSIPIGSDLRTSTAAARIDLQAGELWLAPGTAVTLHPDHVELLQGDALVHADEPMAIRWGTSEAQGTGVFRMRLGATPRVGVYRGEISVSRPAERATVTALRQVSLTGRRLHSAEPLAYRAADAWDSIWMDEALQLDAETARLAGGIERSYGADPQPPEFYLGFDPDVEPALGLLARTARQRLESAFGPPSDTLLTLFVAQSTGRSPLAGAVRDVLALRAEGARWGLVGVELDVTVGRLAAVVDLGHAQQVAAADTSAPPTPVSPPVSAPAAAAPVEEAPARPAQPSPAPPQPPAEEPDEPEEPGLEVPLAPVTDPLEDLLDRALEPLGETLGTLGID